MQGLLHRTRSTACAFLLACRRAGRVRCGAAAAEELPTTSARAHRRAPSANRSCPRAIKGTSLATLTAEALRRTGARNRDQKIRNRMGRSPAPRRRSTRDDRHARSEKQRRRTSQPGDVRTQWTVHRSSADDHETLRRTRAPSAKWSCSRLKGTSLRPSRPTGSPPDVAQTVEQKIRNRMGDQRHSDDRRARDHRHARSEEQRRRTSRPVRPNSSDRHEALPTIEAPANQTSTVGTPITSMSIEGTNSPTWSP